MDDYIALHTYDYKLAFCQATNDLPGDMQRCIWEKLNTYESQNRECPGRLGESNKIRASHPNDSESWSENGEKMGEPDSF